MEGYEHHEAKSILHCGHLYHKSCLKQHEHHLWNNQGGRWPHPYSECPVCKSQYDAEFDKFDYEKHFEIPWFFKEIWYHREDKQKFWSNFRRRYLEHVDEEWNKYVTWNTNYC